MLCQVCGNGFRSVAHRTCHACRWLKARYGLTKLALRRLIAEQGGGCGICGTKSTRLVVDHRHGTKEVRGALCDRCNMAIGLFGDDAALIGKAHAYMRRFDYA